MKGMKGGRKGRGEEGTKRRGKERGREGREQEGRMGEGKGNVQSKTNTDECLLWFFLLALQTCGPELNINIHQPQMRNKQFFVISSS
jgi:hypothetical protein